MPGKKFTSGRSEPTTAPELQVDLGLPGARLCARHLLSRVVFPAEGCPPVITGRALEREQASRKPCLSPMRARSPFSGLRFLLSAVKRAPYPAAEGAAAAVLRFRHVRRDFRRNKVDKEKALFYVRFRSYLPAQRHVLPPRQLGFPGTGCYFSIRCHWLFPLVPTLQNQCFCVRVITKD